jgi:hypothetical protein
LRGAGLSARRSIHSHPEWLKRNEIKSQKQVRKEERRRGEMSTWQMIITLAVMVIGIFVANWLGMRLGGAKIGFIEYLSPLWNRRKTK